MTHREITIFGNKRRLTAEFQPIIHLSRNTIFRYEALARFYNEDGLLLSTLDAIKVAEVSGAIYEVTDFIFDYICLLLKQKDTLRFSFNLSPVLLSDPDYIKQLHHRCTEQGIAPQRIDIEIGERVTHPQLIAGLPFLEYAKSCGFTVSLDDFGAGNLTRDSLDVFAFDTIKIDRSMIARIDSDADRWNRLQAMMATLQPLGVNIVCEGVERQADLEQLRRYREIAIQGYIFYRPLTLNQLKLLEDF